MRSVQFQVDGVFEGARAATLTTVRGEVKTPVFMPVGTQAAVRSVSPLHLQSTPTQIVLANTYHLAQRPGAALIAKAGGVQKFMGIDLPVLTDSGGFQVFSLDKEVSEEGVMFRYEVDGKKTFLSPESSMEIQQQLGSDIAMVFDECLAYGTERSYAEASLDRTHRWERRCKEAHQREDQALFGIVQGAFWEDLRAKSAREVSSIGFDGYAIGGLSVGEGHRSMCEVLEWTLPHMPVDAPRYLMGVGRPLDLVEAVARGVDMFDCVIQTRHARSGVAWTSRGRIRLTDRRYRNDFYPIDPSCSCYTCTHFSRAYLNHLFRVGEVLSSTLVSIHNLHWFADFMARMRTSILEGTFSAFREEVWKRYPEEPRPKNRAGRKTKDGRRDKRR